MSISNEAIVEALELAARLARTGAQAGGKAGVVFGITAAALEAGAALAADGQDPPVSIRRILSADPVLARVRDRVGAALDAKFGPR